MAEYSVAIIYARAMGYEDVRAFLEHIEIGFCDEFQLFVERPLEGKAKEVVDTCPGCKVILAANPRKEAKALYKRKKSEGLRVFISPSVEFGYRGLASDPL